MAKSMVDLEANPKGACVRHGSRTGFVQLIVAIKRYTECDRSAFSQ